MKATRCDETKRKHLSGARGTEVLRTCRFFYILVALGAAMLPTPCDAQDRASRQAEANRQSPSSSPELYLEELQRNSVSKFGPPVHRRFDNLPNANSDADFDRLILETSRGLNLTPAEEVEFRQKMIERKRRFQRLKPQSQYENPALYQILEFWAEKIKFAARKNFQPHDVLDKTQVIFGTLPTGEVNAQSILVPSTRNAYLIVFESGFFDFADLMSLAFSCTLPIEQTKHGYAVLTTNSATVLDNIRQHPELQARFLQVI